MVTGAILLLGEDTTKITVGFWRTLNPCNTAAREELDYIFNRFYNLIHTIFRFVKSRQSNLG